MKKHRGIKMTLNRETLRQLSAEETQAAGGRTNFPTQGATCTPSCSPLYCSPPPPLTIDPCIIYIPQTLNF